LTEDELRLLEHILTTTEIIDAYVPTSLYALRTYGISVSTTARLVRDRAFLLRVLSIEDTDEFQQRFVIELVDAYRRWLIRDCRSYPREVREAVARLCAVKIGGDRDAAQRFAFSLIKWRNSHMYKGYACVSLFDTAMCAYTPYLLEPDILRRSEAIRLINTTMNKTDITSWDLYELWLKVYCP
jgi:hypothetical protein